MANPEHLAILKQGVAVWNEWRENNPEIRPDLFGETLEQVNLSRANLRDVTLEGAGLAKANLSGADLLRANLLAANLNEADLTGARLAQTNLTVASFVRASLIETDLSLAVMLRTDLNGADVSRSTMHLTTIGDVDLRMANGLASVVHDGPSTIGIDTIYRSQGKIPEVFLRGCGVPDTFIEFSCSLVGKPIEFYSCFISYSSKDKTFAAQLHNDLQNKGVRVWFAPEDLKIGDKFRMEIDRAIRISDKLMVVLSEKSIQSQWVEKEVETAFEKERQQNRTVLFPIRLDDAVMKTNQAWAADIRRTRHIGDFSRWKDHDSYQAAFDRLLRDLKAEEKMPGK